jgi:transcriptional regulator with XRE-family HTH domain
LQPFAQLWRNQMATHAKKAVPGGPGPGYPPRYRPEFCEFARELTADGWTMEDIAAELGVSKRATSKWRHRFPEFASAIQEGRKLYPQRLADALARERRKQNVELAAELRALLDMAPERLDVSDEPDDTIVDVSPGSQTGSKQYPSGTLIPQRHNEPPAEPASRDQHWDEPDWRNPQDGEPVPMIDPFDSDW